MNTKKQIKAKKKSISENSVLYVGFSNKVLSQIPIYALTEAINTII